MTKTIRNLKLIADIVRSRYNNDVLGLKQNIIFSTFMFFCALLFVIPFLGEWDGGVYNKSIRDRGRASATQDSHFSQARYYLVQENKKKYYFQASELLLNNSLQKSFANLIKGYLYTSKGDQVDFEGDKGVFDEKLGDLMVEGSVVMDAGDTKGSAKKMHYLVDKETAELLGDVETMTFYPVEKDYVEVKGEYAKVFTDDNKVLFRDQVRGKVRRDRKYEESLHFSSQYLFMNLDTGRMDLSGDVSVKKQLLTANSRRGEIFLENYNKRLKYFALYDDVRVEEQVLVGGQTPVKRRAFSEKLEGMMNESRVTLTGYPKVYQQGDIIKGSKIILRENTEVIEVIDANTNLMLKE